MNIKTDGDAVQFSKIFNSYITAAGAGLTLAVLGSYGDPPLEGSYERESYYWMKEQMVSEEKNRKFYTFDANGRASSLVFSPK